MKSFRHSHLRCVGVLVAGVCILTGAKAAAASSQTSAVQCGNPGTVLKQTVQVSAGGPYVGQAGVPLTLHGTYTVAGQSSNMNQLTTIGVALAKYLQANGSYPPAALLNQKGQPTVSWRVLILPYLGEKALYNRFDLTKPWDSAANLPLLDAMPAVYRSSGASAYTTETGFAGIQGNGALFQNESANLNGGHAFAGLTQSENIAAGPVGGGVHLPWTEPGDIDIAVAAQLGSQHGFSGQGNAFTPLLFLDGTVHLMPNNVDAGSMITWTHVADMDMSGDAMMMCACATPNSVDAGLTAVWDFGKNASFSAQGFNVTFMASKAGQYTVTMHVFDHFGNEYNSTTKVEVR